MPKKDLILNLPGFTIKKVSGLNPIIIEVSFRLKPRCIYCYSKRLRKKSNFIRQVRHESIGLRQTILRFKAYKFYCACCHKYFNQRFPGILKYQRATERLHKQVFSQHTQGVCQKTLAKDLKLGKATVFTSLAWQRKCSSSLHGFKRDLSKPCSKTFPTSQNCCR